MSFLDLLLGKRKKSSPSSHISGDAEFREEDHPRRKDGKFGKGGGTSAQQKKAEHPAFEKPLSLRAWAATNAMTKQAPRPFGDRGLSENEAKGIRDRMQKQGLLNSDGTLSMYHVTMPEYVDSIKKDGLIPAKKPPPGQDWQAEHAQYAVYCYLSKDVAKDHAEQAGGLAVVEARVPINSLTLSRILPDEDSSMNPSDGVKTVLEGGTVAFIGGFPPNTLSVDETETPAQKGPSLAPPPQTTSHPEPEESQPLRSSYGIPNAEKYQRMTPGQLRKAIEKGDKAAERYFWNFSSTIANPIARRQYIAKVTGKAPTEPQMNEGEKDFHKSLLPTMQKLGIPPEMVLINSADSREFKVGDRNFQEGGSYTPSEKKIRINSFGRTTALPGHAGTLAHEFMHHKFDVVMEKLYLEKVAIQNHDRRVESKNAHLLPDGSLRTPALAKKFPIYAAINHLIDYHLLKEDDGVTDYSTAYWDAVSKGKGNPEVAVNETLAEMAKLDHRDPSVKTRLSRFREGPWAELYRGINNIFKGLQK